MKKVCTLDIVIYIFLTIIALISLFFGFTNATYFDNVYAQEDGFIEYGTFVFLFLISLLQFYRLKNAKHNKPLWIASVLFLGLLFFFGAGEEISWGQRIFGTESGDFFKNNNLQNETNLHNLEINGVKINKLIFSQLLTLIMAFYLLVLPYITTKFAWIKNLVFKFAIPIPKLHHIIAFLLSTAIIAILPNLSRKWEVYELFFACIFFLIFCNPKNPNEVKGIKNA